MIKIITIITKFIVATLIALLFASCNNITHFRDGIKGNGNRTTETRPANSDLKTLR